MACYDALRQLERVRHFIPVPSPPKTGARGQDGKTRVAEQILDATPRAELPSSVPVRPLPGPSRWLAPVHGVAFIVDPFSFLRSISERYGDIAGFRMGPVRYCLLNRPDYIKEVLVTRNSEFTKGSVLQHTFRWIMGNGLLSSEGDFHLRQRRLCQPAFEPARIARYVPNIVNAAEAMQSNWRDGDQVNAYETMNELALTIASQTLFGCAMGDRLHEFHCAYTDVQRGFSLFQVATSVLMYKLGIKSHFSQRRSREARQRLDDIVYGFIDEKQHAGGDDLISSLIRATDTEGDGRGMDRKQIRDEAMTFLIAGHDTIAATLTWSWYLLAENPECEARLHAELDAVLGDRSPTHDDLPRLPYAQRVFMETMRLYPAIWTIGRTAIRDVVLDGYRIPVGCNVMVSPYLTQRDGRYFPDPERFDPDRWRDDASPPADLSYYPFGGGKRRCIGRGFALTEGPLVLSTLARSWRMRRVDAAPMDVRRAVVLSPRTPLLMTLERRKRATDEH